MGLPVVFEVKTKMQADVTALVIKSFISCSFCLVTLITTGNWLNVEFVSVAVA